MIRIEVPATSANLGSGFDSLGIALTKYNQVWMEEADYLEIQAKDNVKIPTDENNLIFWAAKTLYEPVSYTHLDVYKRQTWDNQLKLWIWHAT